MPASNTCVVDAVRWRLILAAVGFALCSRACLIDPQKDFPVGVAHVSTGGESAQGGGDVNLAGAFEGGATATADGGMSGYRPGTGGDGSAGAATTNEPAGSCVDWQTRGVRKDGLQVIDPDGSGPIVPFSVFCSGMSGADPLDYLELPHTDATGYPGVNTSTFARLGGDICPCPESLTSSFPKVRLRVTDLTILVDDRSFATSSVIPPVTSRSPTAKVSKWASPKPETAEVKE